MSTPLSFRGRETSLSLSLSSRLAFEAFPVFRFPRRRERERERKRETRGEICPRSLQERRTRGEGTGCKRGPVLSNESFSRLTYKSSSRYRLMGRIEKRETVIATRTAGLLDRLTSLKG